MNDAVAGVKQICGELLRCLTTSTETSTASTTATVVKVMSTPASATVPVPITVQRLYDLIDALNQNMWLKRCILG